MKYSPNNSNKQVYLKYKSLEHKASKDCGNCDGISGKEAEKCAHTYFNIYYLRDKLRSLLNKSDYGHDKRIRIVADHYKQCKMRSNNRNYGFSKKRKSRKTKRKSRKTKRKSRKR